MSITLFTSESVCAGHPDKICDQISDAILDEILRQDPNANTGIETVATADRVILLGEVRTTAKVDFKQIARDQIKRIGYTDPSFDFTDQADIDVYIRTQSHEIATGVDLDGAGDQGMMFGFACRETPELMPLPITLAHELTKALDGAAVGKLPYLRPDGKAQVTVSYEDGQPKAIGHITIAKPHTQKLALSQVKSDLMIHVIRPVLERYGFSISPENVIVNGTGIWHNPGPASDAGLTGRKIVVDGYGGYARVGGGAFSGKDPSKVDRSGAYAARFIAKNLVAAGLVDKVEVSVAYFIGAKKPCMKHIDDYGTATVSQTQLYEYADKLIDTSVKGIIQTLDLRRPIYTPTASYGHFGRPEFPWEQVISVK